MPDLFRQPKGVPRRPAAPPAPDPAAEKRKADRLALADLRRQIAESDTFRPIRDDAGNVLGSFPAHWTLATAIRFLWLAATVAVYDAHKL